jgi:hypothetical protein
MSLKKQNIRNRATLSNNIVDWEFLNECFGGKIRPSDMDCVVEVNDKFLWIEVKPPGYNWNDSKGQKRLYTNLARTPGHTVLVIYGSNISRKRCRTCNVIALADFETKAMEEWGGPCKPATNEDVQKRVSAWYHDVAGCRDGHRGFFEKIILRGRDPQFRCVACGDIILKLPVGVGWTRLGCIKSTRCT